MKNLIVLQGASAKGKSSTLNLLRQRLESNPDYKIFRSEPHPDGYDWTSVVDGPSGKVEIITFGDPGAEEHVNGLLGEMETVGTNIIIVASRTRGGVWQTLQEFADNNDYNVIATAPLYSAGSKDESLIETLNSCEAAMLEDLIEKLSKF